MRLTLGLLAGALLLLAGCGTYRSTVGHTKPDSVVQAIIPTSGESGDTVQFQAQVCSKPNVPDPDYLWNFGGGADPNVSFDVSPTEVLRAGSATPYNASLKLTGGCLGVNLSATYPFQLSIAPLTVLSVSGTTGQAGQNGVFNAVLGTGVATNYSWDFGGAASPSGSTDPNPTVKFTATPGLYNGSVTVSNDYEAVTQTFTINVV
jgi:PKD repeat protein